MRTLALTAFVFALAFAPLAHAAQSGGVILTIDGATGDGKPHAFTLADLEKLPPAEIKTATPWHDGVQQFGGVLMSDLMKAVGAKGKVLHVRALDDYKSDVPVADFDKYKPIMAYLHDGKPMPVRDKGPLFIVYPYDSDPALRNEMFYTRSAWQIASITVE